MQLREAAKNLARASESLRHSSFDGDNLAAIMAENLSTMTSNIETRVGRGAVVTLPVRRCPCGDMTVNDCAGECGRPGSNRR
jgi:hypothetical protein